MIFPSKTFVTKNKSKEFNKILYLFANWNLLNKIQQQKNTNDKKNNEISTNTNGCLQLKDTSLKCLNYTSFFSLPPSIE